MKLKSFLNTCLIALGLILVSSAAYCQCSGQPGAGLICANNGAFQALPNWYNASSILDRNFGAPSVQGTILNRGSSLWSATATPTLGLNGTAGGSLTLEGATSGSVTLGVKAAAGSSVTFNLPTTNGSVNQVLITDGSGNTSWTTAGAGTVSSVGLSLPSSILTVSGSPITGTGTLTGSLATQTANFVWAGPTTGSAATPTFRALVGADLPNPSSSSLGGVQSIAVVSHEWISTISTSGVPSLAQPAFTDISGTLAASQCPDPTTSAIGCVQAVNAVTSNWIRSISTSGVPALSQPSFGDISGSISLSQLPTAGNNTVIGNNSGGTAAAFPITASNVLDMINNVQGDVLYRGASGWTVLAPGTSGQVLTTAGASANPTWTTVTGTGTVTSVATNNGITGGTITTTGTIGLATISTGNVLAYTSGGTGVPVATAPTAVLDVIGSTEGDILYRGASTWSVLGPGTNGQVLQTQGAGSTPQWANAGSVSNVTVSAGNGMSTSGTCTITTTGTCTLASTIVPEPQGRVTLQANTPVMTTSQSAQTTLRYDCYVGAMVPYYNGTTDLIDTINSCEVTDAMVSAASAGQVVSGQVYDVWWVHSGTNRICLAMSSASGGGGGWASDSGGSNTVRGTGYSQIDRVTRPYITNKNSIANCFNGSTNYGSVSANQGTYLGTIAASANGQISWIYGAISSGGTAAMFGVWNMYNRVSVESMTADSTSSWNYASTTVRAADGSSTIRFSYVIGIPEDAQASSYNAVGNGTAGTVGAVAGVCHDVTNAYSGSVADTSNSATAVMPSRFVVQDTGLHFVSACENASASSTVTFIGTSSLITGVQSGLFFSSRM
jgi:hypothetical protein